MNKNIKVSVLMSVYNTKREYLIEAIESILKQTLSEFEFIIIDDKSTDGSNEILKQYKENDERIVLVENENNLGLTRSLNRGLKIAKGKYIARMDSDDISLPERLERQYEYMEAHPQTAVLGGLVFINEKHGLINRGFNQNPEVDRIQMMFRNAGVSHPTAFIRKSFLENKQIKYDEEIIKSQDYALWYDVIKNNGVIDCLPEIVLRYRVHDGQISQATSNQMMYSNMVTKKALFDFLGEVKEDTIKLHCSIADGIPEYNKMDYIHHFSILRQRNVETKAFDQKEFNNQLSCMWFRLCIKRFKYKHKIDFLISRETLKCVSVSVAKSYYYTYLRNNKVYENVKKRYILKMN